MRESPAPIRVALTDLRESGNDVIQRGLAVLGLALASPLMAVSAVLIKLSSRGPVIFKANRLGQDGVPFTMFKLRTMVVVASPHGSITATSDPRVFRTGRWLRRLKLDELPQLVNVARGEMRFFGPRPEAPEIVRESYREWMRETLTVPPGVVGPGSLGYFLEEAEIPADPEEAKRYYASVLLPRKLARDLVFVRDPTVRYQLELLCRTLLGIVGLHGLTRRQRDREQVRAEEILRSVEVTE